MKKKLGLLFGKKSERVAAQHIRRNGGRIVARNWRCKRGEVDLVVIDDDTLVFVEVKARKDESFARAHEHVNRDKRRRIEELALDFCRQRRVEPAAIRFDVVFVIGHEQPRIEWVRDAWTAGE